MTGSLSTTSAKSIQMIAKMQSNIAGDAPSEHFDGQQANSVAAGLLEGGGVGKVR